MCKPCCSLDYLRMRRKVKQKYTREPSWTLKSGITTLPYFLRRIKYWSLICQQAAVHMLSNHKTRRRKQFKLSNSWNPFSKPRLQIQPNRYPSYSTSKTSSKPLSKTIQMQPVKQVTLSLLSSSEVISWWSRQKLFQASWVTIRRKILRRSSSESCILFLFLTK